MQNKAHISIAFLGEFRPLHIEAASLKDARREFLKRCKSSEILERFSKCWKDFQSDKRRGLGIESISSDCSRLSVRIGDYPRDSWLDSVTASFPVHPELIY